MTGRNRAERVRNHMCMDGDVEKTLDMLNEGIEDSAKKQRFGAMAQLIKIKLELGAKLYEVEERTKAETADKNMTVTMLWAQPKRDIE